jgi:hypothetical protein
MSNRVYPQAESCVVARRGRTSLPHFASTLHIQFLLVCTVALISLFTSCNFVCLHVFPWWWIYLVPCLLVGSGSAHGAVANLSACMFSLGSGITRSLAHLSGRVPLRGAFKTSRKLVCLQVFLGSFFAHHPSSSSFPLQHALHASTSFQHC